MAGFNGKWNLGSLKVVLITFIGLMLIVTGVGYMLMKSREEGKLAKLMQYQRVQSMVIKKQQVFLDNLNEARLNVLAYLLTDNEINRYQALYAIREIAPTFQDLAAAVPEELKTGELNKVLSRIYTESDSLSASLISVLSEDGNLPEIHTPDDTDSTSWADSVFIVAGSGTDRLRNAGIDEQFDQLNRLSFIFDAELETVLDKRKAVILARGNFDILIGFILTMLAAFLLFVYLFRRSIGNSIEHIGEVLQKISGGELPEKVKERDDEFGILGKSSNQLIDYLKDASDFAIKIGEGNFQEEFAPKSEHDQLGNALLDMRNRLSEVAGEDKIRNWVNEGQTKFANILRQYSNDIQELGDHLISGLVEYTGAVQGGLFVLNDREEPPFMELLSSYAYGRKKYEKRKIQLGEGLAGQVFLERKEIYITDIREAHFYIQTGMGGSKPASVLIVPLMDEDKIEGVLELASLKTLDEHHIGFVKQVAGSIASSLRTSKINHTTRQLLEDTRQKAEEMKAQEEELRQNMEELSATQEQMERLRADESRMKKEIEDRQKMMIDILNRIPEKVFVKDKDGKLVLLNQAVADAYGKTIEELIGTTDFDFFSREEAEEFRKEELKVIEKGEVYYNPEEKFRDHKGKVRILQSKKMPFYISYLDQNGLLGVQLDVTDARNRERELKDRERQLEEAEQKLREELDGLSGK